MLPQTFAAPQLWWPRSAAPAPAGPAELQSKLLVPPHSRVESLLLLSCLDVTLAMTVKTKPLSSLHLFYILGCNEMELTLLQCEFF